MGGVRRALRSLGRGHLSARGDRADPRGLFGATLDMNRSMGIEETRTAVLASAGSLLRSPDVTLTPERPGRGVLAAPMKLADRTLWLGVAGRSPAEPFDDADRALLEALASVGAVALANAELYAEVRQHQEKLSVITRSLGEGVCAVSEDGRITFMNPAGASMLGWFGLETDDDGPVVPAEETPDFLLEPAMRAMALRRNVTSYDTRFQRLDGSHFPVTMTASPVVGGESPSGAVIVFRDTSERKAFEEQLARHAFQDALTGLANRRLLLDHLDHALLQADRTGSQVAVLFCDIDRFKVVNDNLGHQVGDELLRVIGDRLRRAVRPGDTLSRFGGDEFVVLLEGVTSPDEAAEVAERGPRGAPRPDHAQSRARGGGHLEHRCRPQRVRQVPRRPAARRRRRPCTGPRSAAAAARSPCSTSTGWACVRSAVSTSTRPCTTWSIAARWRSTISRWCPWPTGASSVPRRCVRWNHPDHGILLPAQFIKAGRGQRHHRRASGRWCSSRPAGRRRPGSRSSASRSEVGVNLSARQFQQADLADEVAGVLRATGDRPAAAVPRDHREPGHGRHRPDVAAS